MTVGWGIIGIGRHAKRMARALSLVDGTGLVSVCSRSLERAKGFATEFGFQHAYDSFDAMLDDPKLHVLYVASPNSLHAEQTIKAAEAGKHVLCEKPMATTEAECQRMIDVCRKNKVKLGVDFQNRYHPAHVEARRLVKDGTAGEIFVTRAQYCHGFMQGHWKGWRKDPAIAGAGALVGTGLHPIDLLRFLLDSEVEEVQALCEPSGIDEMDYIIMKFKNGARGIVVTGNLAPRSDNDAILYGTKAKITCKGTVGMPLQGEFLVEGDSVNMKMTFPVAEPAVGNYIRVAEAFNRCITENAGLDIPGENGLQMVSITNAILQSSREGRSVKITVT